MNLPGYRLHELSGDRAGTWSVTVSGNWRIAFRFENGNALDVDFVDYHEETVTAMQMKNPPHPGRVVRDECLEPLGLTVTEAARVLGVTRQALNNLVNEKAGISPEMAFRLAKAFGSTAETWLRMQMLYDLSRIEPASIRVNRYKKAS
jgi:addiction module HigA family antidote